MSGMEPSNTGCGDRSPSGRQAKNNAVRQLLLMLLLLLSGCAASRTKESVKFSHNKAVPVADAESVGVPIVLASHQADAESEDEIGATTAADDSKPDTAGDGAPIAMPLPASTLFSIESLPDLESYALNQNPQLRRLAQEYEAARAKVCYVDGLPDPTVGANVFAAPIETAAGSQRANLTIAQMLPWLPRLDAQAQQACFEAMALQQVHAAERLRVVGDIRAAWYRLYVIEKQIEISEANQELLKTLIEVANARVATGKATQGDVLVGTVEYSKLEEQLVTLRQQRLSTYSEINRLVGRDADIVMESPSELNVTLPEWNHSTLKQIATENQPDIQAARIRTQATRWGLEVARLKRRPDFSVNASWFAIDSNRPPSMVVDVGDDAWSLGASVSIPLWERKYDAIEREASLKHAASHASVDEAIQRYDSVLLDLWEQARAAGETATLYKETILPQAKDTLEADQQSYVNGSVDFDRVVRDFRNLLTLELGYHRALGQLATALARIRQAIATDSL